MGRKEGPAAATPLSRKLGLRLIQCGLDQGPPSCQVPSWSIRPFCHNRHRPKIGGSAPFLGRAGPHLSRSRYLDLDTYTLSQKKTVQISFCQNFIKFPPILINFGRNMAKRLKLCEVYLISISPNSHYHTTMLNADVPNCYKMLKVVICNKLSSDFISTQETKVWFM